MELLSFVLEIGVIVVALWFAPAMVYGVYAGWQRRNGVDLPPWGEVVAWAFDAAMPTLRGLWWGIGLLGWLSVRVLAPKRAGSPPPWPYVESAEDDAQDDAETPVLSGLSASSGADPHVDLVITPGDRAGVIEALVRWGWTTGNIRGLLKGDNGAIGQEVEAARQRIGVKEAPRTITVKRDGVVREVEL